MILYIQCLPYSSTSQFRYSCFLRIALLNQKQSHSLSLISRISSIPPYKPKKSHNLGTHHLTCKGGGGGGGFFVSFRIFFSDNTRVRIFIFVQNLTLGYMTKTLNQIIFISSTKIWKLNGLSLISDIYAKPIYGLT